MKEESNFKNPKPSQNILKAVIEEEKACEEHMSKSSRVKEDKLEDLNLGSVEDPKNVRTSAKLTSEFKRNLRDLLFEFKDIFAWHYTNMKGVNPKLYQHKINLKKDDVLVVQRRYKMNPNFAK